MSEVLNRLLEALRGASDQRNPQRIKECESQLRGWESEPGFYSTLTDIILNVATNETAVRWQAALYVKNGIDKYWRTMAPK